MAYLRWGIGIILFFIAAAFLHYSLPDREIVKIVGTEVVRIEVERPDGSIVIQDQRQINGQTPNGRPSVFRNEDTDWAWPPYLKFDSANLQAQAQSARGQNDGEASWMVVRHYGWRIPYLSMFPNALSMRPATGPDEALVPWLNIFLISLLALIVLIVWRVLTILFDRHVAPVIEGIDVEIEQTSNAVSNRYRGIRGWFRRVFGG